MNDNQIKQSVLSATAKKFFPDWDVKTGVSPEPWAVLNDGKLIIEVHVPASVPLDKFEEETWWQFKKLMDAVVEGREEGKPIE